MSETVTETAASLNGTGPAPAGEPCADCATTGEKALAVVAALFGVFILVVAVDMFLGGRIGGYVRERVPQ